MRRYGRFRDGGSREHDLSMPRKLHHQNTQTSDKHPSSSPVKSSPIKVSSTSPYSLFGVGWNKPLVMLPTSEERKHQTIWTRFGKTRQYTYRSRPYLSSSRCKVVLFRRFPWASAYSKVPHLFISDNYDCHRTIRIFHRPRRSHWCGHKIKQGAVHPGGVTGLAEATYSW